MARDVGGLIVTKKSLKKIWWAITICYIMLIYATLGFAPAIWKNLNTLLQGKGVLAQYIIYSLIGIIAIIYIVFIKKERAINRYFLFLLFIGMSFIMLKLEKNPGEKIHLAEYGLLGVLLYNALKIDFDRFSPKLYIYGSLICVLAGAFDEVIQWLLPNRYFTLHDIFVNGLSGIIALLVTRFNILASLPSLPIYIRKKADFS